MSSKHNKMNQHISCVEFDILIKIDSKNPSYEVSGCWIFYPGIQPWVAGSPGLIWQKILQPPTRGGNLIKSCGGQLKHVWLDTIQ